MRVVSPCVTLHVSGLRHPENPNPWIYCVNSQKNNHNLNLVLVSFVPVCFYYSSVFKTVNSFFKQQRNFGYLFDMDSI